MGAGHHMGRGIGWPRGWGRQAWVAERWKLTCKGRLLEVWGYVLGILALYLWGLLGKWGLRLGVSLRGHTYLGGILGKMAHLGWGHITSRGDGGHCVAGGRGIARNRCLHAVHRGSGWPHDDCTPWWARLGLRKGIARHRRWKVGLARVRRLRQGSRGGACWWSRAAAPGWLGEEARQLGRKAGQLGIRSGACYRPVQGGHCSTPR